MEISFDGNSMTVNEMEDGVSLDDIMFSISKQFYPYKMFVVIEQGTQFETLELKQVNSTKRLSYSYKVEYYPVKLRNGTCTIQLFGINLDNEKSFVSDKVELRIANESYNFKASIYMLEKFNKISSNTYNRMLNVYNKFVELSNLNVNVLNELEKEDNK